MADRYHPCRESFSVKVNFDVKEHVTQDVSNVLKGARPAQTVAPFLGMLLCLGAVLAERQDLPVPVD